MSFNHTLIQRIAHLARLDIENTWSEGSIEEDLSQIIRMIDEISKANTEGIQPMAHPLEMQQRLREDCVTESNERDTLLAIAPLTEAGLFLVPTVLEE